MNNFSENSGLIRILDRLQDMLLVFMLLGAPLIFYTKANDVFEFNKITALRFSGSLSAMVFALRAFLVRRPVVTRSPMDWPVLAWLMVCIVCTVNTVNIQLSAHGVYEDFEGITTWVNYVYLYWLTQQHVRSRRQIHLVIGSVIMAGAAAGFYGILQNFQIDFVPWDPATYSVTRMFSTMGNPNFLAAYLVMSLPITLAVFLDLEDKIKTDKAVSAGLIALGLVTSLGLISLFKINYFDFSASTYGVAAGESILATQKFWAAHLLPLFPFAAAIFLYLGRLKLVLLLSMIFQVVAIAYTKSRGGGLSMLVVGVIFAAYFFWEGRRSSEVLRKNRNWLAGFVVLVLAAHVFIAPIRETTFHMVGRIWDLTDPQSFKLTPRLYIWRSALQMWADRPWFGWGLDTFQVVFSQYRSALYWTLEWNGTPEKAHNVVMQTAATMGTAGLVAFFWILTAYVAKTLKDLKKLADSRQRLLVVSCFAASMAFLLQDLFSFTVVGYGSLFWVLLGFGPAMSRTWMQIENPEYRPRPLKSGGLHPSLLALISLAAVLVWFGSNMQPPQDNAKAAAASVGLIGFGGLFWAWLKGRKGGTASKLYPAGLMMALPLVLGLTFFSIHSLKIWAADSFYKQGQIGNKIGRWDYAVNMLSKAGGKLLPINQEQVNSMMKPEVPLEQLKIKVTPGLSPDQELYWVKQGIAYEAGAAAQTDPQRQEQFYLTALATHQRTVEMSPVNGYNYNNKARVLKNMGEKLKRKEFFQLAKNHYNKSLELDPNNFYFNIEAINNDINLAQQYGDPSWLDKAYEKSEKLIKNFPAVALPYSYRGFIELRRSNVYLTKKNIQASQSELKKSALSFSVAISKDWKGDATSRGLAAANLGLLKASEGRKLSVAQKTSQAAAVFSEAARGYGIAAATFPEQMDHQLNYAKMLWAAGDKQGGCEQLSKLQGRYDAAALKLLIGQMGCRPAPK